MPVRHEQVQCKENRLPDVLMLDWDQHLHKEHMGEGNFGMI